MPNIKKNKTFIIVFAIIAIYIASVLIVFNYFFDVQNKGLVFDGQFGANEVLDELEGNAYVEQTFIVKDDNFSGITLKFNKLLAKKGQDIKISLYYFDLLQNKILIDEIIENSDNIKNAEYQYFPFELEKSWKGEKLAFKVEFNNDDYNNRISIMYSSDDNEYSSGEMFVNGNRVNGVIAFQQVANNLTAKMIFNRWAMVYVIAVFCLLIHSWRRRDNITKIFFPVALVLGLLFMLAIPAFRGQDETSHFYRAYEVSEGHFLSDDSNGYGGRMMPESLLHISLPSVNEIKYSDTVKAMNVQLEEDKAVFVQFPSSALYPPMIYYPQAFGIWLAKSLGVNPLFMVYFGRFFNLLLWACLMVLALQILFFGKRALFLLCIMPMTLANVGTLSCDAMTNAFVFLYISYVLYLTFGNEERISKIQIAFLSVLCLSISLSKIVFMPICFLCFMIPMRKFESKKKYFLILGSITLIAAAINIWWILTAMRFLNISENPGVNTALQMQYVMQNPFQFIKAFLSTILQNLHIYILTFYGASLGWSDLPIYSWIPIMYLLAMLSVSLIDNKYQVEFRGKHKALMIGVIALVTVLIFSSIYVQFNAVQAQTVSGVQGRYFMPLALLFVFLFNNKAVKINMPEKVMNFSCAAGAILIQLPVLLLILMHHI